MKTKDRPEPGPEDGDEELSEVVREAFERRGELPPTTTEAAQAAMDGGVAFEGELPASLRELGTRTAAPEPSEPRASEIPEPRPSERAHALGGAASQRVVSLEDLRRRREQRRARPSWATHAATFGLGAAAAAAVLLTTRPEAPTPDSDPAAGVPTASASATEPPPAPVTIPAVTACSGKCCAGSGCEAAVGELRRCLGGRSCVACEDDLPRGSAFRVRLKNLVPAAKADVEALRRLDLCVRVGASAWSCEPAIADAATRPEGRVLGTVASASDLTTSIELELRPPGGSQVLGRWRDAVRLGPTVLCHGLGALLATEGKVDLGSVAISLEDAHFVELERSPEVASLRELRGRIRFTDVVPSLVETTRAGDERFALAVGPLDKATADRLRWALLEAGRDARLSLGADYVGAPAPLP